MLEFGTIRAAPLSAAADGPPRQSSRAALRFRLYAALLTVDLFSIVGAFFVAGIIYEPGSPLQQWLVISVILTPIYIAIALHTHAYDSIVISRPGLGVQRAFRAFVIAAGTIVLAAFYLKTSEIYSRGTLALGSTLSAMLLLAFRYMFLTNARRLLSDSLYSVTLITDRSFILDETGFSLVISARGEPDPVEDTPAMFDRLARVLAASDRVIVSCALEKRQAWVRILKGAGIKSEILVPELRDLAPLGLEYWDGCPTVVVADGPLSRSDAFVKRAFDLLLASAAIIVLLPLLAIVAIWIKIDSPGPVLFIQTRIGQGNRLFRMLKFRSMRTDVLDQAGGTSTSRDDARVTPIGRFIRSTSIDELPQLFNVLLGDMSIVGPRPHPLGSRAEDKLFWEIDGRYWHRHAAKPGLTGLAQIRGYRGATLRESDLTDRLQADLEYLNDWSIWKDIRIIILTFGVIVHKNAF